MKRRTEFGKKKKKKTKKKKTNRSLRDSNSRPSALQPKMLTITP